MLRKLLKYDFIEIFKSVLPIYLLGIVSALLVVITRHFASSNSIVDVLSELFMLIFVVTTVAILFVTFFASIRRYYINVLKDEGYLTNVLPVKKSSIILSKFISSLVIMTISIFLVILLFILVFFRAQIGSALSYELIKGTSNFITYGTFTVFILIQLAATILCFFAALSLGHMHSRNKIMLSIIYGVGFYIIVQLLVVLAVAVTFFMSNDFILLIEEDNASSFVGFLYLLNSNSIVYGIFSIIVFFITNYTVKNHLNLE